MIDKSKSIKDKYIRKPKNRYGFTLIELVVVMSIVAVLVLLGGPKFLNKTQDAHHTKHIANIKTIEEAAERYYLDHGKWPREDIEPYTPEELTSYAERIRDNNGEEVTLTEGNYWDIDFQELESYVKLPDDKDRANYVLRNPVGKIYYLENLTQKGIERLPGYAMRYEVGHKIDFSYTGEPEEVRLAPGKYQLEVWGAQGGSSAHAGGKGGYSKGTLNLKSEQDFYVYIGGEGSNGAGYQNGGWNGGGGLHAYKYRVGSGGGATDIRVIRSDMTLNSKSRRYETSEESLLSRIIVGGGGGGSQQSSGTSYKPGVGGGLEGGGSEHRRGIISTRPTNQNSYWGGAGTQTAGGNAMIYPNHDSSSLPGSFGYGSSYFSTNSNNTASGAGGAGWYGGGTSSHGPGGGGSGYVLTVNSHKPLGYIVSSSLYLTDTKLIPGNQSMPNPKGGTMVGNTGHGFARITVIGRQ